jgi:hypothetical protein
MIRNNSWLYNGIFDVIWSSGWRQNQHEIKILWMSLTTFVIMAAAMVKYTVMRL